MCSEDNSSRLTGEAPGLSASLLRDAIRNSMAESMTGKNQTIEKPGRGVVASGSENPTEETCRLPKTLEFARLCLVLGATSEWP